MKSDRRDYVLFGLLATFWGGSFVAIKFVVRDFPPMFGAMLRVGLATIILAAIFRWQRRSVRAPFHLRWRMWVSGIFMQGLPFCLLFIGERQISPGLAGIINGTVPIWTYLLGLFYGSSEKLTSRKKLGLALGLGGIAVIFAPLLSFRGTRGELMGTCAVVGMAVSYGLGGVLNRALLAGAKADLRASAFQQQLSSLAFLVLISVVAEPWPGPAALLASPAALVSVAYLAFFSTALALLIYYHLIREWGAVRAASVTYVSPIISLFWDFVFFRNVPGLAELLGAAAILSGVVLLHQPSRSANAP